MLAAAIVRQAFQPDLEVRQADHEYMVPEPDVHDSGFEFLAGRQEPRGIWVWTAILTGKVADQEAVFAIQEHMRFQRPRHFPFSNLPFLIHSPPDFAERWKDGKENGGKEGGRVAARA